MSSTSSGVACSPREQGRKDKTDLMVRIDEASDWETWQGSLSEVLFMF